MKKYLAILLSAFAALSVGCGSSQDYSAMSGQVGQPQVVQPPVVRDTASLRVVNPTGTISNLVVQVDGAVIDGDLDAQESTMYVELGVGNHTVTITDGTDTLATTTLATVANNYYTTVFIPTPLIAAQTTVTTPQLLTLTDDVTPSAGDLNVRLVNASNYDGQISLFNDNEQRLLGPVEEGSAGPYVTQGAEAADSSIFVVLFESTDFVDLTATFTQESNGDTLVESLVQEVGASGANISFIVQFNQPTGEAFITALIDEASDGSRSILSTATVRLLTAPN